MSGHSRERYSALGALIVAIISFVSLIASDIEKPRAQPTPGIGKLGLPFGTTAAVRGIWKDKMREGDHKGLPERCFVVTSVNGVDMDKSIEFFSVELMPFADIADNAKAWSKSRSRNDIWECDVWETASFVGYPKGADELFYETISVPTPDGRRITWRVGDFRFRMRCELHVFRLVAIKR